jgi:hypothetical protein
MASTYPSLLDNFTENFTDASSTESGIHAGHHNDLADAVGNIENILGINPHGSFASVVARLNARQTCRKTSDQTISSTVAPTNLTDLVLTVGTTGLDYYFKFIVVCTSSAGATNGIRVGLTCPALTGFVSASVLIPRTIDANPANGTAQATPTITTMPHMGHITSSGDSVVSDIVPVGINFVVKVEGILSNPSATGSIQLQAANEVNTSNGNVIKRGSFGEIYIN